MKRKLRTYAKCFGIVQGLSILLQEITTFQSKRITVLYADAKYPIHLRLKTSDIATFVQVFLHREYEMELAMSPRVIVDAGANIGLASIYYANKYPDAKILALEPEESNYKLLKKNTASYSNIIAVNKALWGENTTLEVIDPGLDKWGYQTHKMDMEGINIEKKGIQSITVDTLMRDHAIDFIDILKVDIEGSEKEVFKSARAWIDKVGMIAIELHDRFKMGCSRSFYNATNDFSADICRGENVFVIRKSYLTDKMRKNIS